MWSDLEPAPYRVTGKGEGWDSEDIAGETVFTEEGEVWGRQNPRKESKGGSEERLKLGHKETGTCGLRSGARTRH